MTKSKHMIPILLLIALTTVFQSWVLSKDNFFIFDDFSHFAKSISAFHFSLFPVQVYNDRPLGSLFINMLLHFFGSNHQAHHAILLILHIFSSILLYLYLQKVVRNKFVAFFSAVFFANWPRSLMAIRWDSAIFDTLGLFLSMTFLNLSTIKLKSLPKTVLLVSTLVLMLRTKESTLFISIIPLIHTLLFEKFNIKKIFKISIVAPILVSVIYLSYLFYLGNSGGFTNFPSDNPYHTIMNPIIWIRNLFRYIYMYLNINESGFSFVTYRKLPQFVTIISVITALIYSFKDKLLLFLVISTCLLFLPVLPMVNMQHELYLYMPSIFIATISVYLIQKILTNNTLVISILSIILLLYVNFYNPAVQNEKKWWLENGRNNFETYKSLNNISNMQGVLKTIVVENINNDNNIFLYGPGHVLNYFFKDDNLKTITRKTSHADSTPEHYCLLDYNNGYLIDKGCK